MLFARRATSTTATTFSRRLLSTAAPKKDTLRALAARKSLKGEVVLVRADLNLPLTKKDPVEITDATRLIEALPTLRLLIDGQRSSAAATWAVRRRPRTRRRRRV